MKFRWARMLLDIIADLSTMRAKLYWQGADIFRFINFTENFKSNNVKQSSLF